MKVITIIGRLTKDCEIRQGKKGEFATFSVAVKDGYGQNEKAIFFDIMYWNTNLKPSLVKGKEVAVTGEFSTNEYKEKTYLKINATEIKLLGNSNKNQSQGTMNVPEAAAKVAEKEKARYAEGEKIEVDYSRDADLDDEETTEETSNETPSQDLNDEIPF